jgi:hypothetical protein
MLIGISGDANIGKDTVAEYLCTLDTRFSIRKFATGVRKVVSMLTNIPPENMLTLEEKSFNIDKSFTLLQFKSLLSDGIMLITNQFPDKILDVQSLEFVNGTNVKLSCTIGKLLQVIGAFFRNFIDKDTWVNYLFSEFDNFIIISDVK